MYPLDAAMALSMMLHTEAVEHLGMHIRTQGPSDLLSGGCTARADLAKPRELREL